MTEAEFYGDEAYKRATELNRLIWVMYSFGFNSAYGWNEHVADLRMFSQSKWYNAAVDRSELVGWLVGEGISSTGEASVGHI
jgi:hypothetical protein